jgi:hypothetical protein
MSSATSLKHSKIVVARAIYLATYFHPDNEKVKSMLKQ